MRTARRRNIIVIDLIGRKLTLAFPHLGYPQSHGDLTEMISSVFERRDRALVPSTPLILAHSAVGHLVVLAASAIELLAYSQFLIRC